MFPRRRTRSKVTPLGRHKVGNFCKHSVLRGWVKRRMNSRLTPKGLQLIAVRGWRTLHTMLYKKGTNRGGGKGTSPRLKRHPRSGLWYLSGAPKSSGPSARAFSLQNTHFYSGGTRIRTGDTMIFRSVRNPTVHRHRAPWAESKRFLEGTDRGGPPPTAVDRHAEVVEL